VFLGREIKRKGIFGLLQFLDNRRMEEFPKSMLSRLSIQIPSIKTEVGNLSGGQPQAVAIARSIQRTASLIIMDEPTAALRVAIY